MGNLRGGLCSFHLLGAHMLYPTLPALLGQAIKACGLQKAVSGLSACVVMEAQLFSPLAQVISRRTWGMSPELSFLSSSETPQQQA